MEQFQSGHIEKLSPETRNEVRQKIQALHAELGDSFSVEETSDEYIIVQGESRTHIIKHSTILHRPDDPHQKVDPQDAWLLSKVIEAQIRFPELETSGQQMKALDARQRTQGENKNP